MPLARSGPWRHLADEAGELLLAGTRRAPQACSGAKERWSTSGSPAGTREGGVRLSGSV